MTETVLRPLSGRGKPIKVERKANGWSLLWGYFYFQLTDDLVAGVLNYFFVDPAHWYPLGASMTDPMKDGLGFFLHARHPSLNPRHASLIAALMVSEGLLDWRGAKPIELRRKAR